MDEALNCKAVLYYSAKMLVNFIHAHRKLEKGVM